MQHAVAYLDFTKDPCLPSNRRRSHSLLPSLPAAPRPSPAVPTIPTVIGSGHGFAGFWVGSALRFFLVFADYFLVPDSI